MKIQKKNIGGGGGGGGRGGRVRTKNCSFCENSKKNFFFFFFLGGGGGLGIVKMGEIWGRNQNN